MEHIVQTRIFGLLQLSGVEGWEFWWIVEELDSQQNVVWWVSNSEDELCVACYSEIVMGASWELLNRRDSFVWMLV
jgi:hypothetical protein